ncbi:MAG: hypothetical protein EOP43_05925 [Sphingobacteriaceae bacterium]|nr:MAG: hypothetical protein EOP43_05925 [Sphingobacteriaceae bacterium]
MNSFDKIPEVTKQIRLLKETGLHSYLNRDINIFKQKFEQLKQLLLCSANNENFEKAFELFYYIFDAVPMMYNRLSDVPIFRAASNDLNEVFSTQSRISYNPKKENIGPGKFNVWYQSMFYGCLPYEAVNKNEYPEPRLVAALECCKELYSNNKPLVVKDITIGRWELKESINAINLAFDNVHLSKNPELKRTNDQFLNHILEAYSPEAGQLIKEIYKYFSSLCRTGSDEKTYYILTALFASLQNYYETNKGLKIDALISSSAASEGHGLNIVIIPDAVERCLWLKAVMMDRYFSVAPEFTTYSCYPITEVIFNHFKATNFNFTFKKYIPLANRFLEKLSKKN